jgi:hypothetical protein
MHSQKQLTSGQTSYDLFSVRSSRNVCFPFIFVMHDHTQDAPKVAGIRISRRWIDIIDRQSRHHEESSSNIYWFDREQWVRRDRPRFTTQSHNVSPFRHSDKFQQMVRLYFQKVCSNRSQKSLRDIHITASQSYFTE